MLHLHGHGGTGYWEVLQIWVGSHSSSYERRCFWNSSGQLVCKGRGKPPNSAPVSRIPEEKEACQWSTLQVGLPADLLGYSGLATADIPVHPANVRFPVNQDATPRPSAHFLDHLQSCSSHTGRIRGRSFQISSVRRVFYGLKEFARS